MTSEKTNTDGNVRLNHTRIPAESKEYLIRESERRGVSRSVIIRESLKLHQEKTEETKNELV